jgi:AcrR family transcriptional regulator
MIFGLDTTEPIEVVMANRQIARSRNLIQIALLELLKEKQFSKVHLSEISERANLSRKTIYNHFENKDAILRSLVDDILEPIFEGLSTSMVDPVNVERGQADFQKFFNQWKDNYATISLIRSTSGDLIILERLQSWFLQLFNTTIAPIQQRDKVRLGEMTISMVSGAFFMALLHWSDDGMKFPPNLMGKYLHSIVGPPILSKLGGDFIEVFNQYAD